MNFDDDELRHRLRFHEARAQELRELAASQEKQARTYRLELARRSLKATAELEASALAYPYSDPTAEEIDAFRERLFVVADGLDEGDIGGWACSGPANVLGVCVYDTENDGVQDHCLMCGEPDERK